MAEELSRHCPEFNIYMESNQGMIDRKLNARRLGLTILSMGPKMHSHAIYRLAKGLSAGPVASWENAASGLDVQSPLLTCYPET